MKFFLATIFFIPFSVYSQTSDIGNWFIYFGDKKINKKWNWHNEVQYRNYNFLGNTDQLLLRTGFGYNLSENNNNIFLGYAFVYNEPYIANSDKKRSFTEHRIFQQFITRQAFGRFAFQHRYRFEQRFFQDDFKLRMRYSIIIQLALNKKQIKDKTLYLTASNEIFMNMNRFLFDRNRVYGGLGYKFNSSLKTEFRVMNQITTKEKLNYINFVFYANF